MKHIDLTFEKILKLLNDSSTSKLMEGFLISFLVSEKVKAFSPDKRLQVGSTLYSVMGDNFCIEETNYNAPPYNHGNIPLVDENGSSMEYLLHSEMRTLLHSKSYLHSVKGLIRSLVITHCPCVRCASAISFLDIDIVFYCNTHDDNKGVEFLTSKYRDRINYTDMRFKSVTISPNMKDISIYNRFYFINDTSKIFDYTPILEDMHKHHYLSCKIEKRSIVPYHVLDKELLDKKRIYNYSPILPYLSKIYQSMENDFYLRVKGNTVRIGDVIIKKEKLVEKAKELLFNFKK